MAGEFTKMRYDDDAYDESVKRSTKPLSYKLNLDYFQHHNPQFSIGDSRMAPGSSVSDDDRIDVDSIMKGLNERCSKSNRNKSRKSLGDYRMKMPPGSNRLESESTRHSAPVYETKCHENNRWDYPHHDPQTHIMDNFQINTRLQAKDDHCTDWFVPKDQDNLVPYDNDKHRSKKRDILDGKYAAF